MKAHYDLTEADRLKGNALCEERDGRRYGIWFDTIEEAQTACIAHGAYCIIDDDLCEPVWHNPNYQSESFEKLRKKLGRILLPR